MSTAPSPSNRSTSSSSSSSCPYQEDIDRYDRLIAEEEQLLAAARKEFQDQEDADLQFLLDWQDRESAASDAARMAVLESGETERMAILQSGTNERVALNSIRNQANASLESILQSGTNARIEALNSITAESSQSLGEVNDLLANQSNERSRITAQIINSRLARISQLQEERHVLVEQQMAAEDLE